MAYTFDAFGSWQTWTAPRAGTIRIYIDGAGGGDGGQGSGSGGNGGIGGRIVKDYNVSNGEDIRLFVGEGGENGEDGTGIGGTGAGGNEGTGFDNGGDGNAGDDGGGGGGGGGSTRVETGDGSWIATADAGGGGRGNPYSGSWGGGGGGGGAGGLGGAGYNGDAWDAEGTGEGGDGGNGKNNAESDEIDGGPGGQRNGTAGTLISQNTGGGNSGDAQVVIEYTEPPGSVSNVVATASGDDITVTYDEAGSGETGFELEYAVDGSWNSLTTVGANDTDYIHSDLLDGEEYRYRVRAFNDYGSSDWAYSNYETTGISAPSVVTATVDANDQITVELTPQDDNADNYRVKMKRDDGTWTDPASGATTTGTTLTVTPSSDSDYGAQVGIDSKFEFIARAETEDANSSFSAASSPVYTDAIPPHNPSVSRPDGETITVNWTHKSDMADQVVIQLREDTGSGYSSWGNIYTFTTASNESHTFDSADGVQEDARYQVRLYSRKTGVQKTSEIVYADYGNSGNVFFEDDFSSGDLSKWVIDGGSFSDADSGIQSGSHTPLGINGPDSGSNYLRLDNSDAVKVGIGNFNVTPSVESDTDVIVRAVVATGSMDEDSEYTALRWWDSDAGTWQDIQTFNWEYNRQGWTQVTAVVPASIVASGDLQLKGYGGGSDYFAVDRVVVSDVLHEYTTPAAPSDLLLDASVKDEITPSWTNNDSFADFTEARHRVTGSSTWTYDGRLTAGETQDTISGLLDGEKYDVEVYTKKRQNRHGSTSTTFNGFSDISTAVTIQPAPTALVETAHGFTTIDISWTDTHDYGDTRIDYRQTTPDGEPDDPWQEYDTVARGTESATLTGLKHGEQYEVRVVAVTEHAETEDE